MRRRAATKGEPSMQGPAAALRRLVDGSTGVLRWWEDELRNLGQEGKATMEILLQWSHQDFVRDGTQ